MATINVLQLIPIEQDEVGLDVCTYNYTCCGTDGTLCGVTGCENSYGCSDSCGSTCNKTCSDSIHL